MSAGKAFKINHRDLPYVGWLKWNTDGSKILTMNATRISYICRDNAGQIQLAHRKMI